MDTITCLGGRRHNKILLKEKQQKQLQKTEGIDVRQISHTQPMYNENELLSDERAILIQQERYHPQTQISSKQKHYVNSEIFNIESSLNSNGNSSKNANCEVININTTSPQHGTGGVMYPHFPPPPNYPPPEMIIKPNISNVKHSNCNEQFINNDVALVSAKGAYQQNSVDEEIRKQCVGRIKQGNYSRDVNAIEVLNEHDSRELAEHRNYNWSRRNCTDRNYHGDSSSSSGSGPWSKQVSFSQGTMNLSKHSEGPHQIIINPSGLPTDDMTFITQDYSYAYYEPGAAMRHSNVPQPEKSATGLPKPPPPNSIRALLSKGKKNKILVSQTVREQYQAKITGKLHPENFYEEISNSSKKLMMINSNDSGSGSGSGSKSSASSCSNNSIVEEELHRIKCHHRKVLGELNLSVEAMLMADSPPKTSPVESKSLTSINSSQSISDFSNHPGKPKNSKENLLELLEIPSAPTEDQLTSTAETNTQMTNPAFCGDLDSGFSGSSGASYIGNLRYHKSNAALSNLMSKKQKIGVQSDVISKDLNIEKNMNNLDICDRSEATSNKSNNKSYKIFNLIRPDNNQITVETHTPNPQHESKARSFWNKKGWKRTPEFVESVKLAYSEKDETKLNPSSWEDPLPLTATSKQLTTAQLHANTSLKRLDPLQTRASYNQRYSKQHHHLFILPHQQNKSALGGTNNLLGGNDSGCDVISTIGLDNQLLLTNKSLSTARHKRLEYTPSTRTINSSEDSWCSEERDDERDDIISEEEYSGDNISEISSILSTKSAAPAALAVATTATQSQQRNSQLRSTFNKAKQHLSFDKWRTSGGGGESSKNNQSISSSNSSSNNSQSSQITVQPVVIDQAGSPLTITENMPAASHPSFQHHHHPHHNHPDTNPPGESPGGRLSRWFSIRRGSTHQYDVGGRDGRNSASSGSLDATDAAITGSLNEEVHSSPKNGSVVGGKMPQVPENEDDSAATRTPFEMDLILPPGSRANGTARAHNRLITPALPPAPPGLSQQQLKRRHIVAAIVHSENSYVATLQRLVNDYKKPLEDSNPPILSSSKLSTLFHRLPEILQCHKMFRIALAECVRNWDRDEKLGDVFVGAFSKPQVLEVYSGFINNFSAAMELAKMEAKRKSALADFFKVKQISAHDRLSFFGLMVKPVQRFPQFILFLQDLLKYTPQGHHDRMSLQLALTQLESLAEMLNERKREAEQYQAFKEMLGHISGTFNTRSLASADNNRLRYLLREDNVTQMEFNQSGFIIKSKQRRLLLLNDKVICVSVAPKQSHDFGATEKLSFKWMYPVNDVEIVDNSTSATLSRILTAGLNRGGSLKSNSSSCNNDSSPAAALTNGADNLCNEMSTLMYDYEVISRINDLVGSLKGTYKEINSNLTRNLMNSIQSSIQRKDEEMAWVDSCCLQIIAKSKSGKEETFTFQTESPSVKKEWVTELRLAQLALDLNNSPAWEIPEHEQRPSTKMPLFVKAQPVYKSQHQTEVRCGCYYSITNDHKIGTARRRFKHQNYLWVCTSDGTSSHIAILSQHHQQAGNLKDVGSFDLVEQQVTSMEFVKGLEHCKTREEHSSLLGDLIWMGTVSRKILIYSATNPEQEEQLSTCNVPGVVQKILYHFDSVYVALTNSTMLIFRRGHEGVWQLKDPQVIQLNSNSSPVSSILPINMNIYASCSNRVAVLNAITGEVQKSFEVKHSSGNQVNFMAHSGIGLWISLKNSSIICLYHTETFKHLQDINIAANVLRVNKTKESTVNNSSIYVTSLLACKGLLWVGTNVGIALTIPLPRLEGVPIISGGVSISCHAHFGPITFLLPLVPKSYTGAYKPPLQQQQSVVSEPPMEITIDDEDKKDDLDTSTVLLRNKDSQNDSVASSEQDSPKSKLDKQNSLDMSFSAKLKAQLTNSPALRRKRYRDMTDSRMSKTLPRGLGSPSFFTNPTSNAMQNSDQNTICDVYGLYNKLIYVKEDYDAEEGTQGNLIDMMYECMRRSDPELAAIPGKVSTLDRRLRMKASRPRSLDLSNWSVDSKSSSLYTSSGSEESMGIRLFGGGRSVSRNSSSASHKTTSGNGSDLGNISENGTSGDLQELLQAKRDEVNKAKEDLKQLPPAAATLKRNKKSRDAKVQNQSSEGKTLITLMGGRGYWRHVWYTHASPKSGSGGTGTMSRVANSNDAHIVVWEKKL